MRLLALDTATEACSAALWVDGEVSERFELAPRGHARLLLPMADGLLAEAGLKPMELDAVAVGRGPGSFTGVRIAIGVAQGIAFAADLPAVPVSTLAALAQGAHRRSGHGRIIAALDARMGEVYWGAFQAGAEGVMEAAGPEVVAPPERVPLPEGGDDWHGAGSGWAAYGGLFETALAGRLGAWEGELFPHAAALAELAAAAFGRGETVAPEALLPRYLRDDVAKKAASRNLY